MKAIFIDIAVVSTAAAEQRETLQALREVVAAYKAIDAEAEQRA